MRVTTPCDRLETFLVPGLLSAISYDPIVNIDLGPLSLSPHGIGIAVGFLLGARLMMPAAAKKGIDEDDVSFLLVRAAIGALIGAHVAYVANHLSEYESIGEILQVWKGGISLLGGFFGAILLALPAMRSKRLSFWRVMDAAAPGMALGVIIGRIGDLIVADHLGKATDFFLGYKCPPITVDTASPCVAPIVHQTALYDLLLTLPLLAVLLLVRRTPRYDGFLITLFGLMYGMNRLIEDFLREDVRHLGLTGSQWTALITMVVCLWHLLLVRKTPRWGRWEPATETPPTMAEPPPPDPVPPVESAPPQGES